MPLSIARSDGGRNEADRYPAQGTCFRARRCHRRRSICRCSRCSPAL